MNNNNEIIINGRDLNLNNVSAVANDSLLKITLSLSKDSILKMEKARNYVLELVEKGEPVYGINTGFGALSDKFIEKKDLKQLQFNLIRSHCTGVGEAFSKEVTRAIMLLRANCLSSGFSGVNPEIVQLLLDFLNNGIHPLIPSQGSVGASGDLAPLSHIALCLIGEGKVEFKGNLIPSSEAIKAIGKKPVTLGPKDGLALINGTAIMAALASLAVTEAENLMTLADLISSMTLEGIQGTNKAYSPLITQLKPHPGQIDVASNMNAILSGSEILESHLDCRKVQDPYSLRCIPQVHGSCRQTLYHTRDIVKTELNSVTDNPLIFVDEKKVISGGNFHGEALALTMDYLAMGLAEICNISERRIEKMMNPTFSDLPAFLVKESGLNSGLMIAHVTAAALASENKYLCHPASVDSIPTSTDKEDHVSMGPIAGRKLHNVIANTKNCLAIELLCSTQALEFRRPMKSSKCIEAIHDMVRGVVPPIEEDRTLHTDIENIVALINDGKIISQAKELLGELK